MRTISTNISIKTMAKFEVTCTQIHNGTLIIEAESAGEALAIAQERLDEVDWEFGEQTADCADEIKN